MSIRIARGAKSRWRAGDLHFRLETTHERDELTAVIARIGDRVVEPPDEISEVASGAKYMSTPFELPDGLAFWLDAPDAWPALADRLVAIVVDELEAAGVDGRLSGPDEPPEPFLGARTQLTAVPRGSPPVDAIEDGLAWVLELGVSKIFVLASTTSVALPPEAVRPFLSFHHDAGRSYTVQARDQGEQRALLVGQPSAESRLGIEDCPHLTLARSGPVVTADVDAAFLEAVDRAREVGDWAAWVAVGVDPRNVDTVLVRVPWKGEPTGEEAVASLETHLLGPAPWQRVTLQQARHLPTTELLHHDTELGELWAARLDDWLREPLTARSQDFPRAMRAVLGRALLTRDVVWERLHPETPAGVDPGAVQLVRRPRPHPTLGATPVELVGLARNQPFGEDGVRVSAVLRRWLSAFEGADEPDARRVVLALAAVPPASTSDGELERHRDLLASWLLRDLTPSLLALAGLGHEFVDHLPSTGQPMQPTDLVGPVLERLVELRSLERGELQVDARELALRRVHGVISATVRAVSHVVGGPAAHEPWSSVVMHLDRTPEGDGAPEMTARRCWWAAADTAGSLAFQEAYHRARTTESRVEHRWREAEMHRSAGHSWAPGFELFLDRASFIVGGRAAVRADSAATSWDDAVAAARSRSPWWDGLEAALAERIPAELVERSWQTGRRSLERAMPIAHRVATLTAAAVAAERVCRLAVERAAQQHGTDDLLATLWSATDRLIGSIDQEA